MIQKENIGGVYVIPSAESSFRKYLNASICQRFIKSFHFPVQFGSVLFSFVTATIKMAYFVSIFHFQRIFPIQQMYQWVYMALLQTFTFKFICFVSQKLIFQSELVHPLVCPYTGIANISDAFPTWNPSEHHLWQLIKYIQFIFQHPFACLNGDAISNQDAADLLRQNKVSEFVDKVKECVRISKDKIYDDPPTDDKHYIIFSMFDEEIHRSVLDNIKKRGESTSASPPPSGLSWVNEGEFKPLSKWSELKFKVKWRILSALL